MPAVDPTDSDDVSRALARRTTAGLAAGLGLAALLSTSCVTAVPAASGPPQMPLPQDAAGAPPHDPSAPQDQPVRRQEGWRPPEPDEGGFDWIMLKSGEWLKGELRYLRDDKLEFESDELDTLGFDAEDVHVIRLSRMEDVVFEGRRVVSGTVLVDRDTVWIRTEQGVRTYPRADVLSIVPTSHRERDYWYGTFSAGLSTQSGNTNQSSANTYVTLRRRGPFSRVSVDYIGNYGTTDGETNINNHRADSRWDLFVSRRWFVTPAQLTWFRDPFQNISKQLVPSAGFGYHVFPNTANDWTISLNGGLQYTEFDSVSQGEDSSNSQFTLIPGTDLDWEITKDLDWRFTYSSQVPFPDTKGRVSHLTTTLSLDLFQDLDLDLTFQWDHVANPAERADGTTPEPNDYRLSVGVGWDF